MEKHLPVLRDHTASAISFFNNHRVPAALLAATAIKDAFVLQGRTDKALSHQNVGPEQGLAKRKLWRMVRYTYLLLMITAFSMEITVIFMSTHAAVQLGAGGFNSEAATLVQMLCREFEYEYVTVRSQFVTGMLAFLLAQALRVRYSLRRYDDLSMCAMFCLISGASGMLAYNNAHTVTFGGYPGLLRRWLALSVRFYSERLSLRTPMGFITVVTALLGLAFLARATASTATALVGSVGWDMDDVDADAAAEDAAASR